MSVYVDDARIAWRGKRWSHMQADSLDELHDFARQLGLKREWFQTRPGRPENDHYDVSDQKRAEAVLSGAIPESLEDGVRRRRAIRREHRSSDDFKPARGSDDGPA